MPVVAIIGAYVGSTLGVGTAIGALGGSIIGGAIGGGIGAEMQGGNFADGFKAGAIGGLIGGVAGKIFGAAGTTAGGVGEAGSQASMLAEQYAGFAPADAAAHMAGSGLSAAEMTSVLGDMGIDYNTAESYVNNATSNNPYEQLDGWQTAPLSNTSLTNQDFTLQDISTGLEQGNSFSPRLDDIVSGQQPLSLENSLANTQPKSIGGLEGLSSSTQPAQALEGMTRQDSSMFRADGQVPIVEAGTSARPMTPTSLQGLYNSAKGIAGELMPKGVTGMQLGMAGLQTLQDYSNANKLNKLTEQANIPYQQYQDTFANPDKYWNEYMQGQGGVEYNKSARMLAKSGRTGTLPSLYTQGHQQYTSNTLPQLRTNLLQGANASNMNLQNQASVMAMKNRASSYLPSAMTTAGLLSLYGKK